MLFEYVFKARLEDRIPSNFSQINIGQVIKLKENIKKAREKRLAKQRHILREAALSSDES